MLVAHPTVNNFVRALVEELHREGLLSAFHTTLACGRRSLELPAGLIHSHPLRESLRLLGQRLGLSRLTRHESGWASVDAVYQALDRAVARQVKNESAVYCYEDGALHTFQAAAEHGIRRIYELPIAYWELSRKLLQEEALRWPQWEPTLFATRDSQGKLERKSRELALADLVVCPSRFVQESLPAGTRSIVAEFGSPAVRCSDCGGRPVAGRGWTPSLRAANNIDGGAQFSPDRRSLTGAGLHSEDSGEGGSRPLRVLFAGSMSQRKGLADLFAALKILRSPQVELIVMGSPIAPMSFYRQQYPHFRHEKPRPNVEFLALMQECDLLVLPSIVEGRALVQQEALSCGLPLIVTPNAGGADLVEEGTGFLVPIRSPERIAESLEWFLLHRGELPRMRQAARAMAARFTWQGYARKIIESLP